jgi:lipoyl(octanoyl) transferase
MLICAVFSVVKSLYLLPATVGPAAENMAVDWLLLEAFPQPEAVRMRFYSWARPSFTFGYGQKWAAVRAACPDAVDLIRRPTGGGLVDHRADWTYALVLPPAHPLAQAQACESYRAVHEELAEALGEVGVGCTLQGADAKLQVAGCKLQVPDTRASGGLAVCFERAERFDIVRLDDGKKIAGAAQKRTRRGLLFQGSVNREAVGEFRDWGKLAGVFALRLGGRLGVTPQEHKDAPWPATLPTETTARFASQEWNQKR